MGLEVCEGGGERLGGGRGVAGHEWVCEGVRGCPSAKDVCRVQRCLRDHVNVPYVIRLLPLHSVL